MEYEVSVFQRVPAAATSPSFGELDPISAWESLRWQRELNVADTYTLTTRVSDIPETIKSPLRHLHTTPLELQFAREGVVVARGPIVDYEIQGGTITINARGILYYLQYMIQESAFARTDTDQATIVKDLIDGYQALSYGNYGLNTTLLTAVGVLRQLTVNAGEFPIIGDKIRQWLDNLNGMDLWVSPDDRKVHRAYPTRGTDRTATVILDARVIRDNALHVSVAAQILASEGLASSSAGTGAAGTAVIGTYSDATLRSTFGRAGAAQGSSSITESLTVTGLAQMVQTQRAVPASSLGLSQFIGVAGVNVGDFDEGDLVGFVYDAGLGLMTATERLRSYAVSVSPTRELLEVAFV